MTELIIIGDEAYTPEELERRDRARQKEREYSRRPEVMERNRIACRKYGRRMRYPNGYQAYRISASLHSFRCKGPTKVLGCVCQKVLVGRKVDE